MCRQNHGIAVDYYAVGVIGYECMYGKVRNTIVENLILKVIIDICRDLTWEKIEKRSVT